MCTHTQFCSNALCNAMAFLLTLTLALSVIANIVNYDLQNLAIDHRGRLYFGILNYGQSIQIPNNHDHKPVRPSQRQQLTISLRGSTVSQLSTVNESIWNLKMADESEISIWILEHLSFTEYYVVWDVEETLDEEVKEFCFHYGDQGKRRVKWFNTYQENEQQWPMNSSIHMSEYAFNSLPTDASQPIQFIVEHLFLNTGGFAVMFDRVSPLFVRRDPNNGDPMMCISSQAKSPYLDSKSSVTGTGYRNIKFSIYSGPNIRSVYESVVNIVEAIPKPVGLPDAQTFIYPNWFLNKGMQNIYPGKNLFTQESLLKFVDELYSHGYNSSLITLDIDNQMKSPYLWFDLKQFFNPKQMIQSLHNRGYRLSLFVNPLVYDQTLWNEHPDYFVQNRANKATQLPIQMKEGGVEIDFTNQNAVSWFVAKLDKIFKSFQLDGFQFGSFTLNRDNLKLTNTYVERYPALLANNYLELAEKFGNQTIVADGHKSQEMPLFVRISDRENNWGYSKGLKSVIPTILALSIGGYSFVMPGLMDDGQTSEELYIRYVQLQTFMPAMAFSRPPWKYSERCANITKQFVGLHISLGPTILELARKRMSTGAPIIRPMWYADPADVQTYSIDSQFMLGDDILVAPVVEQGAQQRLIYLPKGIWIDQRGKHFYGPLELQVSAQLEQLPYFRRHLK